MVRRGMREGSQGGPLSVIAGLLLSTLASPALAQDVAAPPANAASAVSPTV